MKLTTAQALDFYQAFVRLDGYPRAVMTNQGPQIIVDSYDLSPKVKWRIVCNREFLLAIKNAFETARTAGQKKFDDFKASLDPKMDEKEREIVLDGQKHVVDSELAALGEQENDVGGLLKLPGEGIRLRARDPNIMGILALIRKDFIDGEVDYGQEKKVAEVKDA